MAKPRRRAPLWPKTLPARTPMVDVALRGSCAGRRCPEVRGKALVDTGAAHSFIVPAAVKKLKLRRLGRAEVRGIAGGKRPLVLDKYGVVVSFPGSGLRDVPLFARGALAKEQHSPRGRVALIGRDAMAGGDDPRAGASVFYDAPSGMLKLTPSMRLAKRSRRFGAGGDDSSSRGPRATLPLSEPVTKAALAFERAAAKLDQQIAGVVAGADDAGAIKAVDRLWDRVNDAEIRGRADRDVFAARVTALHHARVQASEHGRLARQHGREVQARALREAKRAGRASAGSYEHELELMRLSRQLSPGEDESTAEAGGSKKKSKHPSGMLASEINRELDSLDKRSSKNTDAFIAAGRGFERPSEYLRKDDPLAVEARAIFERKSLLRREIERRYGPGAPSRLPRGFGPIKGVREGEDDATEASLSGSGRKKRAPTRPTRSPVPAVIAGLTSAALGASGKLDRWVTFRPLGASVTATRAVIVSLVGVALAAHISERRDVRTLRDISAAVAGGLTVGAISRAILGKAA